MIKYHNSHAVSKFFFLSIVKMVFFLSKQGKRVDKERFLVENCGKLSKSGDVGLFQCAPLHRRYCAENGLCNDP